MAKSSSFFNLRRGSTRSLTFSVLKGQQITKDRVSIVSNPRTEAQSIQRMKLTSAKNFWLGFKNILDHSFEGKRTTLENYNQFMQLALRSNGYPCSAKGESKFKPGEYQISKGSLLDISLSMDAYDDTHSSAYQTGMSVPQVIFSYDMDTPNGFWDANPNLKDGDQFTKIAFLRNQATGEYSIVYDRMFLHVELKNEQYIPTIYDDNVDGVVRFCSAFLGGQSTGTEALAITTNNEETAGFDTVGYAVIVSRKNPNASNTWLRSNSFVKLFPDALAELKDNDKMQECIKSFMTAEKTASSDKYLDGSDTITLTRVTTELISGVTKPDAESCVGKRTYVGYDAAGTKYGISNTDGNAFASDGTTLTYETGEEPSAEVQLKASEIKNFEDLVIVAITRAQLVELAG